MRTRASQFIGLLALALIAASCTVKKSEAPALAGPSELALSLSVQALPDQVRQDGFSQSAVTVEAKGPNSQPARGITLRVDMLLNGDAGDFGTLSARTIVTGDDGRARVTYTAPPGSSSPADTGSTVTLRFTPIGGDYRGAVDREVDIRVIPTTVIVPPSRIVAQFVYSPTGVTTFQSISFDASASTDNGTPCGASCTYTWTFGDGGSSTGMMTTHEFRTAGTFVVTLRVTNGNGQFATTTQSVTVAAGTAPTAAFTFSPTTPAVSQDIFFSAAGSTAAPGRRLVAYDWDFGSGRTGSGVTVAKKYDTAGTYNVTLTVVDDAGQQGIASQPVTVGGTGTGPIAVLAFSPTSPRAGLPGVIFDASASRGPSPIVEYRFTFGDSTTEIVQTTPVVTHPYPTPATYVARLTVRDSAGRTATTTVNVTVVP